MKSIDSADVAYLIEEADEDMIDAQKLSGRSAPAARYSASQAAEKYLRAVCEACDRPAGVMWDIRKIYDTVADVGDIATLGDHVALLAQFTTPARAGDGKTVRMPDVIFALKMIRWTVRKALGIEETMPEAPAGEDAAIQSSEVIDSAMIPEDDDMIPTILPDDAQPSAVPAAPTAEMPPEPRENRRGPDQRDLRSGRSDEERGASFVKMFLVCDRCGVRIPRTRQTAHGRVPCSMCGRPMKLQR
jgi:HEPN domain-containing protein